MTLRILLVADSYPPTIGGVELQMQMLGRELTSRGHQVCVATLWQAGLLEVEQAQGVEIQRIKGAGAWIQGLFARIRGAPATARKYPPPFPDPGLVIGLRRIINQFKPDVVHAYGWITYSCAAALLGKKIPMLLSVREYGYTCALRTMMYKDQQPCTGPQLAKCLGCSVYHYGTLKGLASVIGVFSGRALLRRKSAGVHSVSTYMQKEIRLDLYKRPGEIVNPGGKALPDVVIPSFRDAQIDQEGDQRALQPYLDQLPEEPFILFVGQLRLVKGLVPLMEAYQKLAAAPPLVLIGVKTLDTPASFPANVKVLFNFPHQAVMAAWERSLFGVAPSIWPEPFGNVIHEAMSKGKAVIGTDAGGQTDMIIQGETGLLVPPNDVPALAAAMQKLIDDPGLCQALGRAGRERSKLFTAGVVVPRFEQLYLQLLGKPVQPESQALVDEGVKLL